jgi:hypothetical protein
MNRPKRVRFKAGDVFAVPLGENCGFGYCRYLDQLVTEFFNLESKEQLTAEEAVRADVAFVVWVSKDPFTFGLWPRIGHVEASPRPAPIFYKQDPISKRLFLHQGGRERPATLADCAGLENAAVWSASHIADRLRDHFAGRSNRWVEMPKPKGI